jgi:hypothetical protein
MKWENVNALSLGNISTLSNEDISYQFKLWKIQQVAWFGILSLIVAALLGFLGGEYTFQSSGLKSVTGISYPYLAHSFKPTTWTLKTENSNEIWMSDKLSQSVAVENISPTPSSVTTVGDRLVLSFAQAPTEVVFRVKPTHSGFVEGKIGTEKEAFSVGFYSF